MSLFSIPRFLERWLRLVRVWLSAWGPAVIGGEALRGAPGPSGLDWAVRLALPSPPDKRRSSPMAEVGLPEAERRRDSGTNGVWGRGLPGGGWREARPAGKGRGAAQRRGGSGRGRASDWSANGTAERGLWAPASGAGRGHLGGRVRVTQQTLRGSRLLRGLCEPLAAKLAVLGGPQVKGRGSKAQDHLGVGLRHLGATRIWGWMVLCCGAVLPPAAPPASPTGRQKHPRPAV